MKKPDRIIVQKIGKYCQDILRFTNGIDFDEFVSNEEKNYACVFAISQIGEIVNASSDEFKEMYSTKPWREMVAVRNRIVHNYGGVKMGIIWEVIGHNIPDLLAYTEEILDKMETLE